MFFPWCTGHQQVAQVRRSLPKMFLPAPWFFRSHASKENKARVLLEIGWVWWLSKDFEMAANFCMLDGFGTGLWRQCWRRFGIGSAGLGELFTETAYVSASGLMSSSTCHKACLSQPAAVRRNIRGVMGCDAHGSRHGALLISSC